MKNQIKNIIQFLSTNLFGILDLLWFLKPEQSHCSEKSAHDLFIIVPVESTIHAHWDRTNRNISGEPLKPLKDITKTKYLTRVV